jgi:HEAT repeat protein
MVFGLFSKDRALKRAIDKATNQRAQSADRFAAMEKLREEGSEEALYALCRRFSFKYDKLIEDQQEKDWVVQVLVNKGEACLGPLRRFLKAGQRLGYPLSVLGQIARPDAILEIIDEVLADEEPGYTRDPQRRIDVIEWLAEWDGAPNAEIARRVIPYLEDFDETVRFKTIEALAVKPSPEAGPPLARALTREEEESMRLKHRIAEVLADNALDLGDRKAEVAALLDSELTDFKLHRDKIAHRKGK